MYKSGKVEVESLARGIQIVSDFVDYYDYLSNNIDPLLIYRRNYSDSLPRGESLKWVRDNGIKTIELGLARQFIATHNKVVVYTDTKAHEFRGKLIVDTRIASDIYSTNLVSPYYSETRGVTVKFLQVGSKRYRITFKNEEETISEGIITKIEELTPDLNYLIRLPIFSLDYIFDGKEMICVDFNTVQNIGNLGLKDILTPQEVIDEIKKALLAYNIN